MTVCLECKNELDAGVLATASEKDVIECGACGITLEVVKKSEDGIELEIADEGK